MTDLSHGADIAEDEMQSLQKRIKRLEQLREYRSRLLKSSFAAVDKFLATPIDQVTPEYRKESNAFVRRCQLRIKLTNIEYDRIVATDPHVLFAF